MPTYRSLLAAIVVLLVVSAVGVSPTYAWLSYEMAWVRPINEYPAHSVIINPSGQLLVGTSSALRTYSTSGDLITLTPVQVPFHAMAVDSQDGIYACGYSSLEWVRPSAGQNDAILSKLDSSGNVLWMRQWGTGLSDTCRDVFVDHADNIYASGDERSFHTWVRKLDVAGNELWVSTPVSSNEGAGVAADANGNVVVVGYGGGSGSQAANITGLSPTGQTRWTTHVNSPEYEFSQDVVVDSQGNIYVSGETEGTVGASSRGRYDIFVSKIDPAGNKLWTQQFGNAGFDYGRAITIGPNGNIYVAGDGTSTTGEDLHLVQLTPDGEVVFSNRFVVPGREIGNGLTVGPDGSVYIVGHSDGSFGGLIQGPLDGFVAKFVPVPEPTGTCLAMTVLISAGLVAFRRNRTCIR